MNKEKYQADRVVLMDKAKGFLDGGDIENFNATTKEVETLDAKFDAEATAQANYNALNGKVNTGNPFQMADKLGAPPTANIYATTEYEQAFMNFATKGTAIPSNLRNADQTTTTSDTGAVIPSTILQEMIKVLKNYGNLYNKVRKLNVQGGVSVPILSLMPSAKWIGENQASDAQKLEANKKVTFSYYGLECKLSQSLLVNVTTLEMFKAEFAQLAAAAIIEAIDKGIVKGTGIGQMLGITKDSRIPAENIIEVSNADIVNFGAWKKNVFAKMKKSYRNGEFVMAQGTFDTYIDGMTDTTGQPIGRVNYGIDGGETYRFCGKTVETVEDDVIESFDTAAPGEVVAIFGVLSNYAINTNMQMRVNKWVDNDTHEIKNNCILICDGKVLDPNGFLILKKKASV